jgi:hypothetical protein
MSVLSPTHLCFCALSSGGTATGQGTVAEASSPPPSKKPRKRPPASALPWPHDTFPLTIIEGEPVSLEATKQYKDPKAAAIAARFWCHRVAYEVGLLCAEAQCEVAEQFVLQQRLSVVNAFYRRLARVDVVAALAKMYQDTIQELDHPLDQSPA